MTRQEDIMCRFGSLSRKLTPKAFLFVSDRALQSLLSGCICVLCCSRSQTIYGYVQEFASFWTGWALLPRL